MSKTFLIILPLLFLTGCATTKYGWNGYDDSLYAYYKHPETKDKYIERLRLTIEQAEQAHAKVPPGIYAEYGYMFFEAKDYGKAAAFFQKEQGAWPESAFFMDKMIRDCKAMGQKTTQGAG